MIFILTGPVGSGKTTALMKWVTGREDTGGILMPLRKGKRFFHSVNSGEEYPAETDPGNAEAISIGPYRFSFGAFQRAGREILKSAESCGTLVIDEIGPLELNGTGFSEVLKSLLADRNAIAGKNLILVVREGLAEKAAEVFGMENYHVIRSVKELII